MTTMAAETMVVKLVTRGSSWVGCLMQDSRLAFFFVSLQTVGPSHIKMLYFIANRATVFR